LRTITVTQQKEVLEDNKRVAGGGTKRLCGHVRKSFRFKLIDVQHAAIVLYDIVVDEHEQCRSVAAAVEDTTAVLNSCSLKHRKRAYYIAYARWSIRQGREDGAQNGSTYVWE